MSISLATSALQVKAFAFFIAFMLFFDDGNIELFNRISSSRIAKFFGDTSYSVYLLHTIIMYPTLRELASHHWYLNLHPFARLFVSFLLVAVPVYGLSYVLLQLVERPGIAFGRRLLRWGKMSPST